MRFMSTLVMIKAKPDQNLILPLNAWKAELQKPGLLRPGRPIVQVTADLGPLERWV